MIPSEERHFCLDILTKSPGPADHSGRSSRRPGPGLQADPGATHAQEHHQR